MKIIDISWELEEGMAVYTDNPSYKVSQYKPKPSGIVEIRIGNHTGTHVDSPKHAVHSGKTVEKILLKDVIGECRVLDMAHVRDGISAVDLKKAKIKKGERILVKTRNSNKTTRKFFADFVYLSSDGAEFLAKKQIKLFGTDYLSVKKSGSKDNTAHEALLKENIVIFEGLNLKNVSPGVYTFIGLPLKMKGLDGAPARAVLIKGKVQ